jgi:hypothetical protein
MIPGIEYAKENLTNIQRFENLVKVIAKEWRKCEPKKRILILSCLHRAVERYQWEGLGKEAYDAMSPLRD